MTVKEGMVPLMLHGLYFMEDADNCMKGNVLLLMNDYWFENLTVKCMFCSSERNRKCKRLELLFQYCHLTLE